ncbi:hypothetical protein CDAR_411101 [Caerostris darwini]|uniref:Uncharacterized protein n=1 Tax=Caerostris darwini TaxID=1538125 RepID=A0AAV4SBZ6_9ARAC|nr:hypothetical protein CDAR_411101 [Caerostris darwini]
MLEIISSATKQRISLGCVLTPRTELWNRPGTLVWRFVMDRLGKWLYYFVREIIGGGCRHHGRCYPVMLQITGMLLMLQMSYQKNKQKRNSIALIFYFVNRNITRTVER